MNRKNTILHVDDDPDERKLVEVLLKRSGFAVSSIADPRDAVLRFDTRVHLPAVLDSHMPFLTGADVYLQLLRTHGAINVVFYTDAVEEVRRRLGSSVPCVQKGSACELLESLNLESMQTVQVGDAQPSHDQ